MFNLLLFPFYFIHECDLPRRLKFFEWFMSNLNRIPKDDEDDFCLEINENINIFNPIDTK